MWEIIMIYTYQEIKNKYKTGYSINKAIEKGDIYKLDQGLYSNKKYVNPIALYSKKIS